MLKKIKNKNMVSLLLRVGLAFVFLYAAISSFRQPALWESYLPNFLTHIASLSILIKIFAVYEIVLGVWLLSGKYVKYAALLCTATLIGIVSMNTTSFTTTFRDVGLAFMAVALFFSE